MRLMFVMTALSLATTFLSGCTSSPEKLGMYYSDAFKADEVDFLVDETWVDTNGVRHVDQEIYDEVYRMIDEADQFVLLDLFLMNDFGYVEGPCMRPLTQELADKLIAKKQQMPDVDIIFITDPVNHVYGAVESPQFEAMKDAGIQVVWTDLDQMPDSNPGYSKLWRVFVKPFGVGPGNTLKNPMGEGRVSMRSMLKLLNFKANHRKVVVTDKALLLTSANPHSASSAHWNVALKIEGAGMKEACEAESAVLQFSGHAPFIPELPASPTQGRYDVELLTEQRIKEKAIDLLDQATPGARIDFCMFYLSEKDVIQAFIRAQKRGCDLRVIIDPSKDSFGRTKNGVPNRQSARKLVEAGVPLRWTETHGEQCHVKMLYVEHPNQTASLMLGSCNYTRRNMNNLNCEADLLVKAPLDDLNMQEVRTVFDRWWSNTPERFYTSEYAEYEDKNAWRGFLAWWMENTGMGTF